MAALALGIVHRLRHIAPVQLLCTRRFDSAADERIWTQPLKGGSWQDVEGNVLLFVPWGILLAMEMARRGFGFIVTVAGAMCTGALLSGSVEVVQLFAPSRTSSFIDLVTNSFGATVGALIGWPWVRLVWPVVAVRLRHWITARPLLTCALVTGVVVLFAGLSPFSFRLAHDLKSASSAAQLIPFGRQAVEPVRSAKPLNWAAGLLTWTLTGGLFAWLHASRGCGKARRHRRRRGGFGAVEFGRRDLSACGSGARRRCHFDGPGPAGFGSRGRHVIRLGNADTHRLIAPAIAIWCLAVIFTVWNPPHITAPARPCWRLERVVPFWSYFHSRTLADLADVIGQVLIFMPFGALLAAPQTGNGSKAR